MARTAIHVAVALAAAAILAWAALADPGWLARHVGTSFCGAPAGPWIALRAAAAGLALLLFFVARPRLARAAPATLAWSALAALLALVAVELLLERRPPPDTVSEDVAPHPDARLGWTLAPRRVRTVTRAGRTFAYAVNAW